MLKMYKPFYILITIGCLLSLACNSPFVPKSKGYSAMQFPKKAYQVFDAPGYPYSFEYPVYAQIDNKVNYFGASQKDAGWINIQFPQNKATIYVSYRKVQPNQFWRHFHCSVHSALVPYTIYMLLHAFL